MRLKPNICAAAVVAMAGSVSAGMMPAQAPPSARRVMLDEAHHNLMATASGGYQPLVRLLADAGFDAVGTDHPADIRVDSWIRRRGAARGVPEQDPGWCFEKAARTVVRGEQRGHLIVNRRFITAGARDEGGSLLGRLQQRCFEHLPNSLPVVRRLRRHAGGRRRF